jgi:hypothetical protein
VAAPDQLDPVLAADRGGVHLVRPLRVDAGVFMFRSLVGVVMGVELSAIVVLLLLLQLSLQ